MKAVKARGRTKYFNPRFREEATWIPRRKVELDNISIHASVRKRQDKKTNLSKGEQFQSTLP